MNWEIWSTDFLKNSKAIKYKKGCSFQWVVFEELDNYMQRNEPQHKSHTL